MTYEEWKARRLERVPGRCGGRPTFIGTRIQPHDVADAEHPDDDFGIVASDDVEHSRRFVREEPHWYMLSRGFHRDGRELTEDEYAALEALYPRMW